MKTYFNRISEVIEILNTNKISYLILRNYENLLNDQIYEGGHEDIDMLCQSSDEIVNLLGAIPNSRKGDGTHYHIIVGGNRVNLDLRHLNDGYYCTEWQNEMLANRVLYKSFYVMSKEDYFYSLVYHAIIQKPFLTEEYCNRLAKMAEEINVCQNCYSQELFLSLLQNYMRQKGYKFTYTEDPSIPLKYDHIDKELIQYNFLRRLKRLFFRTTQNALKKAIYFKHLITD